MKNVKANLPAAKVTEYGGGLSVFSQGVSLTPDDRSITKEYDVTDLGEEDKIRLVGNPKNKTVLKKVELAKVRSYSGIKQPSGGKSK